MNPQHLGACAGRSRADFLFPALVAAALLACAPAGAVSQEKAKVKPAGFRTGFTESVSTASPGTVHVESGVTVGWKGDDRSVRAGELKVKLPLAARADLRLGVTSYSWQRKAGAELSGLEDGYVGLAARVVDDRPRAVYVPAVLLLAGAVVPSGGSVVGAENWLPKGTVALKWSAGGHSSVLVNGVVGRAESKGVVSTSQAASAWAGHKVTGRITAYGEGWTYRSAPTAEWKNTVSAGLAYQVSPRHHVDVRAGTQLGAPARSFGVGWVQRW